MVRLGKFANRWTNRWTTIGLLLTALAASLTGCSSNNNAKAGIVITAASATTGASSVTIPVNGTEQFAASVTGISSTTVQWQVCLPSAVSTKIPTNCTTIPGVTPPKGSTPLSGYGTINQNGFYTAPSSVPAPNNFVILVTSPADLTAFATFGVIIDSGIRVTVTPSTATIDAGEHVQLTANVAGTTNTSVTWQVAGIVGGNSTVGFICPNALAPQPCTPGEYFAPAAGATTQSITAISGADGKTQGTAVISIAAGGPTLTSIEPRGAVQGSVAQQVYLTGTNFTSNGSVMVNGTAAPYIFLSGSLLRATIPGSALQSAGNVPIAFQTQSGGISGTQNLQLATVRPAIVSVTPESVSAGATPTVDLIGGYFTQGIPATTVAFDGAPVGAAAVPGQSFNREMAVALPAVNAPGLYALTVQNTGVPLGQPSMAAINVAVTPTSTPGAPAATIPVGAQPSAIAVDLADGLAIVAEKAANAVAIINLATNTVTQTIAVGAQPTGVAVDDMLTTRLALVVNSGDNTLTAIALNPVPAVVKTVSLAGFTPLTIPPTLPMAIGINPQTHRALVANASTNLATIIDLVNPVGNCATAPCPLMTVGGSITGYSTGANPNVGIDPQLNWAVVTPGGAGVINLVDLGFGSPSPGSGGRAPGMVGTLTLSTTIQGVGINPETHTALFTDSNSGAVTEFSLLNNSVNSVTNGGIGLTQPGEIAAAANPLQNLGIAVNNTGSGAASVIDMGNHAVITPVTLGGGTSSAVAIDPVTNEALIANSTANTVTVVSLTGGSAPKAVQVLEVSPTLTFTSGNSLAMTITGSGLTGATVLLDGTSLTTLGGTINSNTARLITATVPASLLTGARNFAVQVQSGGVNSNVEPLTVVQAIPVGKSPAGVAVDVNRDAALVTNSGDGTVSVLSLASSAISPESLGAVGVIGSPLSAHANPRGVAVDSRLGVGVAANYDSNDVSLVDYSGVFSKPYSLPAVAGCQGTSICTGPAGVAFNEDTGGFIFTNSNVGAPASDVSFGTAVAPTSAAAAIISVDPTPQPVDQTPGDLAIAPSFNPGNPTLTYAAIASAAQTSVIDFLDTTSQLVVGRTNGVSLPSSVIYDWLNNVFLVSDSSANNIVIVDPVTFIPTIVRGGFNPLTAAYNPQTSTIGVVNSITGTVSVLDYLCPPSAQAPACPSPQVQAMIGQVGSPVSPTAPLGAKTLGIDPRLNLGVLVDPQNNRVLLVPLPH